MGDVHLLCLAGRQMTTNAALSIYNTVTLWPKAELEVCLSVFRIKPKLPSMPYQLQEIHCLSLSPSSLPCLSCTQLLSWHSIHRDLLAVLPGTLRSSPSPCLHTPCTTLAMPFLALLTMTMIWLIWIPTVEPQAAICTFFLFYTHLLNFYTTLSLFPYQFLIGLCCGLQRQVSQAACLFLFCLVGKWRQLFKPWNFKLGFVLHTSVFFSS